MRITIGPMTMAKWDELEGILTDNALKELLDRIQK